MKRPTNKQVSEFVRDFDKLTHVHKMAVVFDLIAYADGTGAPYGIVYDLHPDNRKV